MTTVCHHPKLTRLRTNTGVPMDITSLDPSASIMSSVSGHAPNVAPVVLHACTSHCCFNFFPSHSTTKICQCNITRWTCRRRGVACMPTLAPTNWVPMLGVVGA